MLVSLLQLSCNYTSIFLIGNNGRADTYMIVWTKDTLLGYHAGRENCEIIFNFVATSCTFNANCPAKMIGHVCKTKEKIKIIINFTFDEIKRFF